MDPISAAASLLSVLDVAARTTSTIVKYGRDVHNASRDKKLPVEETTILSKVLNRLRERAESTSNHRWLADQIDVFQLFQSAFDDLAKTLNIDPSIGQPREESRLKALKRRRNGRLPSQTFMPSCSGWKGCSIMQTLSSQTISGSSSTA